MKLGVPVERCYYYECFYGNFRLSYYLPKVELESLTKNNKISKSILEDFPDGYDLDCTEPDFEDFKDNYNYEHSYAADLILSTFKSIFTSTKNWKTTKSVGWIGAEDLEKRIKQVEVSLEKLFQPKKISTNSFLKDLNSDFNLNKKVERFLIKNEFEGIPPSNTLKNLFSVKMTKGDVVSPNEFFTKILNKY